MAIEGCIYCGGGLERPTPEHVILRSRGAYEFIIDVCSECNTRANRWIDIPIVKCSHVRRVRADLGLIDERGRPYGIHYTGDIVAASRVDDVHG